MSKRIYLLHESESREGREIEVMEVFADDPDDEQTVTLQGFLGGTDATRRQRALAYIETLEP